MGFEGVVGGGIPVLQLGQHFSGDRAHEAPLARRHGSILRDHLLRRRGGDCRQGACGLMVYDGDRLEFYLDFCCDDGNAILCIGEW